MSDDVKAERDEAIKDMVSAEYLVLEKYHDVKLFNLIHQKLLKLLEVWE